MHAMRNSCQEMSSTPELPKNLASVFVCNIGVEPCETMQNPSRSDASLSMACSAAWGKPPSPSKSKAIEKEGIKCRDVLSRPSDIQRD